MKGLHLKRRTKGMRTATRKRKMMLLLLAKHME
jgi:hypothetical protein